MGTHEQTLTAFLAGELDERAAAEFDAHMLTCADCWQALREDRAGRAAAARLRDAAPADLADRVRMTVELADRPRPERRRGRWLAAGALAVAAAVIALVVIALPERGADPPAIATVVAAAQRIPEPTDQPDSPGAGPVAHGQRWTVRAGVAQLQLQYYRLDGVELLVAHSDQPVGTPQDARSASPGDMPWTVDRDGITVYCPHDDTLVAAAVPADRLADLAQRLPRN
jgi:anti-sigma factor RsiW